MKLIFPLDFQLRVYQLVSLSSICIPSSKSFSSQFHMIVFLVLRIKQHVYGLAHTIVYKIDQVTGAVFQTIEMYPAW